MNDIFEFEVLDGKQWYGADDKIKMYKKKHAKFKPGVTVLVGCNGAGKTTLIRQIREFVRNNDEVLLMEYNNWEDGQRKTMQDNLLSGNLKELACQAMSSEGENIIINIENLATKIGFNMSRYKEDSGYKKYIILFDAIDSGLSIDHMVYLKNFFNEVIKDSPEDKPVYIVLSTNSYEFARDMPCYDIMEGKYITFKDYEEYREFILKTAKLKNIRYGRIKEDSEG